MPESIREHRVQLGCGTLIVIALIVMFFSRGDTDDLENEISGLRSEVGEIKKLIEVQTGEIRQLKEKLPTTSPKPIVEKARRIDQPALTPGLFVRALDLRRRLKDIFAFQGDLKGVCNTGHVMAAARPEEDVEGTFRPEVIDQPLHVVRGDRPGFLGLFASEQERGAIAWGKGRPVPAGQPPCPFIECQLVEARDREQHFAVAHSVKAMDRAGHDPEQALLEDPVLLRFLAERRGAGRPGRRQLGLIAHGDQAPPDADRLLRAVGIRRQDILTPPPTIGTRIRLGRARWLERLSWRSSNSMDSQKGSSIRSALRGRVVPRDVFRGGTGGGLGLHEPDLQRWHRTAGLDREVKSQEEPVLKVGIGQQQDHGRDLLLRRTAT